MSTLKPGELVDITIRGARVEAFNGGYTTFAPKAGAHITIETGSAGVDITRVAPREWPPQAGDVWVGESGDQFFARTGEDGDAEWLVPVSGGSISSYPEEILASFGPLRLAYRRGWSPEPAPAADADAEKVDKRAEVIAGLREMADWYEANPGIPLDLYGWQMLNSLSGPNDEAARAELLRVAELVGEPANLTANHPDVKKMFRGRVAYRAYYIPTAKPADEAANEDLTGGGGEVAGPAGVSGPATAPASLPRLNAIGEER